jgi:bacterioferritin-associated ferredoxin
MIVCHCNRVTAAEIEAECLGGASSTHEVRERCGAGNRCGGCQPLLQVLVSQYADGPGARTLCDAGVSAS